MIDSKTIKDLANMAFVLSSIVLATAAYWSFGNIKELSEIAAAGSAGPETYAYLLAALRKLSVALLSQAIALVGLGAVTGIAMKRISARTADSMSMAKDRFLWPLLSLLLGGALISFFLFLLFVQIPKFQSFAFTAPYFYQLFLWYKRIAVILMPIIAVLTILFGIRFRQMAVGSIVKGVTH